MPDKFNDILLKIDDPYLDDATREEINQSNRLRKILTPHHYEDFTPDDLQTFEARLTSWLLNLDGSLSEQRTLFRVLRRLFFINRAEFRELYRIAYEKHVWPWLFGQIKGSLTGKRLNNKMAEATRKTWFTPLTDSCLINEFYNANNITCNLKHRPHWFFLEERKADKKLENMLVQKGIDRIVILEDFVGTGGQGAKAVWYAATFSKLELPVLFIPLIICPPPKGVSTFNRMVLDIKVHNQKNKVNHSLSFSPVMILDNDVLANPSPNPDVDPFNKELRDLADSTYSSVTHGKAKPFEEAPYHPYGLGEMGLMFIMHSNCPDNSMPFIHHGSEKWDPLFPRNIRE